MLGNSTAKICGLGDDDTMTNKKQKGAFLVIIGWTVSLFRFVYVFVCFVVSRGKGRND